MKRIACSAVGVFCVFAVSAQIQAFDLVGEFNRKLDMPMSIQQQVKLEGIVVDSQYRTLPTEKEIEGKIIGGQHLGVQYPWMVALIVENTMGNKKQFCGGTLIAPDKVLTAAHCNIFPPRFVSVFSGDNDLDSYGGSLTKVKKIVSHPSYQTPSEGSDVAVITLDSPLVGLEPVSLVEKMLSSYTSTPMVKIMGWGITSENGQPSRTLLEATVPIVENTVCNSAYPNIKIGESMMCAGMKLGGIDTCQGDSGGPAMLIQSDSSLAQVGVTSFGYGCGEKDHYGVYSNVPNLISWVKTQ